jgi:hypothetical protein
MHWLLRVLDYSNNLLYYMLMLVENLFMWSCV